MGLAPPGEGALVTLGRSDEVLLGGSYPFS